jgi:hypothetical protein
MTKFRIAALAGIAAASIAGAAFAAAHDQHVMTVTLPDGAVAKIEYSGDIPPKLVALPAQRIAMMSAPRAMMADPFDSAFFAQFDAMHAAMMRQMQVMQAMATMPAAAAMAQSGVHYAATGGSSGMHFCSQSVSVTAQGPGKPAKVVTESHGDCGGAAAAPRVSAPAATPATPAPGLTIVKATAPAPVKPPATTI